MGRRKMDGARMKIKKCSPQLNEARMKVLKAIVEIQNGVSDRIVTANEIAHHLEYEKVTYISDSNAFNYISLKK